MLRNANSKLASAVMVQVSTVFALLKGEIEEIKAFVKGSALAPNSSSEPCPGATPVVLAMDKLASASDFKHRASTSSGGLPQSKAEPTDRPVFPANVLAL